MLDISRVEMQSCTRPSSSFYLVMYKVCGTNLCFKRNLLHMLTGSTSFQRFVATEQCDVIYCAIVYVANGSWQKRVSPSSIDVAI